MKKYSRRAVNIALASTALIGAIPLAGAVEYYQNPNSGITKLWKTDPQKYGKAVSKGTCYANTACAQEFENAIITWNKRNGARALTGKENVQTFKAAGGVEKLGALEGDSFTHSYCGSSATTYNNTTRYLLVLNGTQKGQSLDLNGAEAKKWMQERNKTRSCFPSQNKSEVASNLDWSQASYFPRQGALVLSQKVVKDDQETTTVYVRQADSEGKPVADSEAFEVPWLSDSNQAEDWFSDTRLTGLPYHLGTSHTGYFYAEAHNSHASVVGYPLAAAVWEGDTATQEFRYGTVTWTKDQTPDVKLNLEGAQKLLDSILEEDQTLTEQTENIYTVASGNTDEELSGLYFIYDARSGKLVHMRPSIYRIYMENPHTYGSVISSSRMVTEEEDGDPRYGYQPQSVVEFENGQTLTRMVSLSEYDVDYVQYSKQDNKLTQLHKSVLSKWTPQDPQSVDWNKAQYYPAQNALVYRDNLTLLIVRAGADHKTPADGAPIVRTSYLAQGTAPYELHGSWDTIFDIWSQGYEGYEEAALGLPTSEEKTVTSDGKTLIVQEFEGGTVTKDGDTSRIELNEVGKARLG